MSRNHVFKSKIKRAGHLSKDMTMSAIVDDKLISQVSRAYFSLESDSSPEGKSDATAENYPTQKLRLPVFHSNASSKD